MVIWDIIISISICTSERPTSAFYSFCWLDINTRIYILLHSYMHIISISFCSSYEPSLICPSTWYIYIVFLALTAENFDARDFFANAIDKRVATYNSLLFSCIIHTKVRHCQTASLSRKKKSANKKKSPIDRMARSLSAGVSITIEVSGCCWHRSPIDWDGRRTLGTGMCCVYI